MKSGANGSKEGSEQWLQKEKGKGCKHCLEGCKKEEKRGYKPMLHDSDSAKTRLAYDSSTRERLGKDSGQTRPDSAIKKKIKYGALSHKHNQILYAKI